MTSRSLGEIERRGTNAQSSARFLPEKVPQEVATELGVLNPALSEAVTQQQERRRQRRPLFNYGHRVRIRKSLSLTFRFSGDSPHVCLRPCRCARVHVCVSVQSRRITADKDVWLPVILCNRFSRRSLSLAPSLPLCLLFRTHTLHMCM